MGLDPSPEREALDDRSPFAKGFDVASRIMTAGAAIGLLSYVGHWLDGRLGWKGPLLGVGAILGTAVFFWQMSTLVRGSKPRRGPGGGPDG